MTNLIAGERSNLVPPIPWQTSLYSRGWTDPTPEGVLGYKTDKNEITFQGSSTSLTDFLAVWPPQSSSQIAKLLADLFRKPAHWEQAILATTASLWQANNPIATLLEMKDEGASSAPSGYSLPQYDALPTELAIIWRAGEEEDFQSGNDSQFGLELSKLVNTHGQKALGAIDRFIRNQARDAYVSAEALKCLGGIEHDATRVARRLMLEGLLNHPLDVIREAAVLALEELNDKSAIPALSAQRAVESRPRLCKDLDAAIRYLQR